MAQPKRYLKIGVVGVGQFSHHFIPLFKAHPYVEKVYVTDLIKEREIAAREKYDVEIVESFEKILESDIDCVAIFVQRHLHGTMAAKALEAGKHVYSAVPMGISVEECRRIIELVKKTRLIYMVGETCYYYPCACFCREKYAKGEFGKFVYGASQYYHDIAGFDFKYTAGEDWKKEAGIPPMYYPTHSFSMLLSSCNSHVTSLSALGYTDTENDGIYGKGNNYWDNPFSNTTALCRLDNGGIARVSEFRRIGTYKPSSYISGFYGTKGAYEYSNAQHIFMKKMYDDKEDVNFEDVSNYVNPEEMTLHKNEENFKSLVANGNWAWSSFAPVHKVERLPAEFKGLPNGHMGSHQFLVDDFVKAVHFNKLPPCNAWFAARCNIPGLIAHESALLGGVQLDVPDLGDAPADWPKLYDDI